MENKGKISAKGKLMIMRAGSYLLTECKKGGSFCTHNCALFKEPYEDTRFIGQPMIVLSLCETDWVFYKENFVDERI